LGQVSSTDAEVMVKFHMNLWVRWAQLMPRSW